jgi:hypothetical protein
MVPSFTPISLHSYPIILNSFLNKLYYYFYYKNYLIEYFLFSTKIVVSLETTVKTVTVPDLLEHKF